MLIDLVFEAVEALAVGRGLAFQYFPDARG
jgi:hypothetical protein